MNGKNRVWAFAAALCFLIGTATRANANEKPGTTKTVPAAATPTAPAAPAQPDPKKMEEMQKMMTPGENHKRLAVLAGSWKYTVKMWMPGSTEPQESKGRSKSRWIMDGRFIQEETTGTAMGKPFKGMGLIGYDNVLNQYTAIWIDNMGTGMMSATGQWDDASNTLTENGTFSCPLTMGPMKSRATLKVVDQNHLTYEMWATGKDKKEQKMMEIEYTRLK